MKDVKIEPINEKMNAKTTLRETFPDSGCQETLVSADLMDYLRLELDRRKKKRIKGIDGKTYVPQVPRIDLIPLQIARRLKLIKSKNLWFRHNKT